MKPLRRISIIELTAAHLREGLRAGRWSGDLPGVARLVKELDVGHRTVRMTGAGEKLLRMNSARADSGESATML